MRGVRRGPGLRVHRPIIAVLLAFGLLLLLAPPAHAATKRVRIVDYAYFPAQVTVARGDDVRWKNLDHEYHTATSRGGSRGPALWDSSYLSSIRDDTYTFRFFAGGGFDYACTLHPDMQGRVDVPISVRSEPARNGTRIIVTVATRAAPEDLVYDIQRMTGLLPLWEDWKVGRTGRRASFVTSDPGTYAFRARVRRLSTDGASDYSPEATITV